MEMLERLMDWLIATSISGTILICIILLTKKLLDKRLGARGHYYIWFLIIIKMLMPFSPKCCTSVHNLLRLHNDIIAPSVNLYAVQETGNFIGEPVLDKVMFSESLLHSTDFKIFLVWAIGLLVFSALTFKSNFLFWRKINKSHHIAAEECYHILNECKSVMQVHKNIEIMITEAVNTPTLTGILRPKILIPAYMESNLNHEQYRHVFLHELTHFKKKDIYIFFLMSIIQVMHWFNPIVWFAFIKMRQDCEVACDTYVLSKLEENEYKGYGQTIIHMLQNFQVTFNPLATIGVLGSKGEIKRRIKMISNYKKHSRYFSVVAISICIVLGFAFLTSPTETVGKENTEGASATEEKIEMSWPVSEEYNKVVSPYGLRKHPITEEEYYHTGIDIAAPKGVDIVAAAEGKVIFSGWLEAYGNVIIIDHGQGVSTFYGHCSECLVKENQWVKGGEIIGKVGSTGMSTGPHLHLEVRVNEEHVDPFENYLKASIKEE